MTRISGFFGVQKWEFPWNCQSKSLTEISIYLKVVLALDVFFRIFDRFASNWAKLRAQLETVIERLRHEFFRQKSNEYRQFWSAAISDEPFHTKYLISQPNISKKPTKKQISNAQEWRLFKCLKVCCFVSDSIFLKQYNYKKTHNI